MRQPPFSPHLLWSRRVSVPIQPGQIAFSPRSDSVLLASSEKAKAEYRATLDVLNIAGGTVERHLTFAGQFHHALWSPRNTYFGAVGTVEQEGEYRGIGCLWETTGKRTEPFQIGRDRAFRCAVFASDGKLLFIAANPSEKRGRIYVWDVAARRVVRKIEGEAPTVFHSLTITAEGRTLVVSTGRTGQGGQAWKDCAIRLYDTSTGRQDRVIPLPENTAPTVVSLSPDGRLLTAGGGANGDILVCDFASGNRLHTLKGHRGEVRAVAVAPNGRWIASGGRDGAIRFWDGDTGASLASLNRLEGEVSAISLSPDGNYLATGDSNGELHVWGIHKN